jgi:hypothetical protein
MLSGNVKSALIASLNFSPLLLRKQLDSGTPIAEYGYWLHRAITG